MIDAYCWNCFKQGLVPVQIDTRSGIGYECPFCGAISSEPHTICPEYGRGCPVHPPLEEGR